VGKTFLFAACFLVLLSCHRTYVRAVVDVVESDPTAGPTRRHESTATFAALRRLVGAAAALLRATTNAAAAAAAAAVGVLVHRGRRRGNDSLAICFRPLLRLLGRHFRGLLPAAQEEVLQLPPRHRIATVGVL